MNYMIFIILHLHVCCFQTRFAQALWALQKYRMGEIILKRQNGDQCCGMVLWRGLWPLGMLWGWLWWTELTAGASSPPQLGKSSLVWTLFRKACGLSCWRRCSLACPVSSPGGMRSCCFWTSSTVPLSCTLRTVPCWGSTLPQSSTQLCTLTTSSPSVGTSGSSPACCRWVISMNYMREDFWVSTLL